VLWRWTGWHYRFRWLLLAYLGLVGSFGAVVLAPNLAVLVLAQSRQPYFTSQLTPAMWTEHTSGQLPK